MIRGRHSGGAMILKLTCYEEIPSHFCCGHHRRAVAVLLRPVLFCIRGRVKAGTLNYVVKKGFIFKTYEGRLIQTGLKSTSPTSMQSNEFTFSIEDPSIAERLMLNSGKEVELHYKEYIGSVPWRGYSEFIVDSVVEINPGK